MLASPKPNPFERNISKKLKIVKYKQGIESMRIWIQSKYKVWIRL